MRDLGRSGRCTGEDRLWSCARSMGAWLAAAAAAVSGCSATAPTELVPGVMTQVEVPRDLSAIQVEVQANGEIVFCTGYSVESGVVTLPATLGVVSATSPETTVAVTIRGYDEPGAATLSYADCPDPTPVGGPAPAPRVLRSSVQTFVDHETLFLPMPLSYSCYDTDCSTPGACSGTACVCKGGQCVDSTIDASSLADFDPALVDGTGVCFSPSSCFQNAGEATVVDATRCVYAAPPGAGINVRVFYDDVTVTPAPSAGLFEEQVSDTGESEILDDDPEEGFCPGSCGASGPEDGGAPTSSPAGDGAPEAEPQLFQLAPGLCRLVHAATTPPELPPDGGTFHAIGSVQVATGCASKLPLLPICAGQQTYGALYPDGSTSDAEPSAGTTRTIEETADGAALTCGASEPLASTPSAIYMIMDDSAVMSGAFGPDGYATVMSLSLADPVFNQTSAAFRFFPETPASGGGFDQSECTSATTAFATPSVPFGPATEVQAGIANLLDTWQPIDTLANPAPLDLQAALRPTGGAYAALRSFLQGSAAPPNLAVLMAFVDRSADTTDDCDPPLSGAASVQSALESEIQAAYEGTPSIRTYFVVLANSSGGDGGPGALPFYQSIAADLPQMVTVVDATAPQTQEQTALDNFSQAAEELGACAFEEPPGGIGQLAYTVPSSPQTPVPVPANAACTAATQATVDGWSAAGGRVLVCGVPCAGLQAAIFARASQLAQQSDAAVPDVSVLATLACDGDATSSDGGPPVPDAGDGAADAASSPDATVGAPATADGGADAGGASD